MSNETPELAPGVWPIDHAHSRIEFVARHLMVTKVRGHFTEFDGSIEVAPNLLDSKVTATVQLASVDTGDQRRDDHLRTSDFFEVDKYPTMEFKSTGIKEDGGDYKMLGDLTIHGVTHPVEFDVEINGVTPDPWGGTRAGFSAKTEINRKDWGLEWNAAVEGGGVLVSDKIQIELEIQATKPS